MVMRWALVSLGLLGAILYVTGTFTPSPEDPSGSSGSAALVWPDDAQLERSGLPTHAIDPSAPSPQEAHARETIDAKGQIAMAIVDGLVRLARWCGPGCSGPMRPCRREPLCRADDVLIVGVEPSTSTSWRTLAGLDNLVVCR